MDEQDKPPGTEQHPPNADPERQGPRGPETDDDMSQGPPPATGEPAPEGSPGEQGVTSPRR